MSDSERLLALTSAAAACFATGLAVAATISAAHRTIETQADPCALPAGIELGPLSDRDRTYVARRAMACSDLEHGRIARADYERTLKLLDVVPPGPPPPPPAPVWASRVLGFSSQYTTTSWSAQRVLGPPDVFPQGGDNQNAWASLEADAKSEFIEVGFDQPHRLRGVDIFETDNPGAVDHVEITTADGKHHTIYDGAAHAMGTPSFQRSIAFACTDQPVVAVRVTLASAAVPEWNEIDAIGGTPCD